LRISSERLLLRTKNCTMCFLVVRTVQTVVQPYKGLYIPYKVLYALRKKIKAQILSVFEEALIFEFEKLFQQNIHIGIHTRTQQFDFFFVVIGSETDFNRQPLNSFYEVSGSIIWWQ